MSVQLQSFPQALESLQTISEGWAVLPCVVAPGRDGHGAPPELPLHPREGISLFRELQPTVLLLVQEVSLSRCSSASQGEIFSFEQPTPGDSA